MRFIAASKDQAESWCPYINEPFLHISIFQDEESELEKYENSNLVKLIKLKFHDTGHYIDDTVLIFNCYHAALIKEAVCGFKGELVVINCEAGKSRSVAVALALRQFFNNSHKNPPKKFNRYVHEFLLEYLRNGVNPSLCQNICQDKNCRFFRH